MHSSVTAIETGNGAIGFTTAVTVLEHQITSGLNPGVKARQSPTFPCGDALHSLSGSELFGIFFPLGSACTAELVNS